MASEKNKNVQRAHLLLGAYWLYMLYRGKRVPEATLDVLKIQRNSLIKEYSDRKSAQQGGKKGSGRSAVRARAGLAAGGPQTEPSPEKSRALIRRIGKTEKILRSILKKQRLF